MNDLVRLNTQDVSKAIPVTSSLKVSDEFKKNHNIVLRDIRVLEKELKLSLDSKELGEYKIVQSSYINSQNKEQPMIEMNRNFFIMLVMGYRTKEAYKIKHKFIQAFNFMENELQARTETRQISKIIRVSMTDSINKQVKPGTFKNFAYGNYTKLVYKYLFGKTVKKLKEERNVPEKENLRNHLTIDELIKVQDLESQIATFIQFTDTLNKTDKEIYQLVSEHFKQPTLN